MSFLEVFFLLFLVEKTRAFVSCPVTICSDEFLPIRFPFILEDYQPQKCGYPGFNLTCSIERIPVLKLPYSGEFYVQDIEYEAQLILLKDPDNCPARRLISLNLSGSPFKAISYRNYTFLSCPLQLEVSMLNGIDCLGNSTHSILATSSIDKARSMSSLCKIMNTTRLPVAGPDFDKDDFTRDLNRDLLLKWDVPNCRACESRGGICGFRNETSQVLSCYFNDQSENDNDNGLRLYRIIILSIAAPAVICATVFACLVCFISRRRGNNTQQIAAVPQHNTEERGLDEATIDSYTKIVLGESKRLPGPNGNTCPICLSEYNSEETVKCIPECEHCFHTECIDEWLRMHSSCPVCRNSPSPHPSQ